METEAGLLQGGVFEMITGSGPVVKAVLFILIFQSLLSWAITIAKVLQFRKAAKQSEEFQAVFWETRNLSRADDSSRRLSAGYVAALFSSGYRELTHLLQELKSNGRRVEASDLETVKRSLERAELEQSHRLEKGVTFLATTASSAPFIGLFGTVWGILNAFHGLGTAQLTTIQAVAPGISEALVATAIGLAAAIPAAIAYNYFAVALRHARESMNRFEEEFLTVARIELVDG
ncbi:MAG: MotA/TolQ/ExbB proton channel family protein [Bdellovibrionales bacterium]|nr:MotA/TolQ/ExbB proton channel family protein [Bdellovibrionales bacterium]